METITRTNEIERTHGATQIEKETNRETDKQRKRGIEAIRGVCMNTHIMYTVRLH